MPTKPPTDNLPRVLRGGGWHIDRAVWVRAAFRGWFTRANRDASLGFRCAQRGARMPLKVNS